MRLEEFIYLQKIAETGSISSAAAELFISQQSVSRAVQSLEKELNTVILERSNRGVTFTESGQFVLTIAKKMINAMDELNAHFQAPQEKISGEISIMANSFILVTYFPQNMSYFYRYLPDVTLNILPGENQEIIEALLNNTADLGFVCYLTINEVTNFDLPDSLTFTLVKKSKLYGMISINSILAKYKVLSLKSLCRIPYVYFSTAKLTGAPRSIASLNDLGLSQVINTDNSIAFYQFIKDNLGWTLESEEFLPRLPAGIVYRQLAEKLHCSLGYISRKDEPLPAIARIFCELFTRYQK